MKTHRLLLASFALIATSAFAANRTQAHRGLLAELIATRIEARLNLTSTQREQVKTILKAEQPTITSLAARAAEEREDLTRSETFDEARIRTLAQSYAATNADILVERVKVRTELRAILTDAQRQQLDELRTRAGGHFEERFNAFVDAL
jgi:protein CpxP